MQPPLVMEYPEVNALLASLLPRIQHILGAKVLGIYLYGSLVYGDFDLTTSDVDLLVVLAAWLDNQELAHLTESYQAVILEQPRWHDRIETAYVTHGALQTFRTHASTIANISPGEPFHTLTADQDWLVNWYMVREYGMTLVGQPPAAVIPTITKAEFVETIRRHTQSWAQWIAGCRHLGGQAYAILTLCRALYTLRHGEQVSKLQAAAWAIAEYPQWATLIRDALLWRKAVQDGTLHIEPAAVFPETVRFVHFAIAQTTPG